MVKYPTGDCCGRRFDGEARDRLAKWISTTWEISLADADLIVDRVAGEVDQTWVTSEKWRHGSRPLLVLTSELGLTRREYEAFCELVTGHKFLIDMRLDQVESIYRRMKELGSKKNIQEWIASQNRSA
jgi:hypothetical protein